MTPMEIVPSEIPLCRARARAIEERLRTLTSPRAFQRLRSAAIPGVIELAPAYTSVAVFFDPIDVAKATETSKEFSIGWRRAFALLSRRRRGGDRALTIRTVEIPSAMIRSSHSTSMMLRERANIFAKRSHRSSQRAEYRVACIGFVPGFPFLAGLPKNWPRRAGTFRAKKFPRFRRDSAARKREFIPCARRRLESDRRTPLKLFDPTKDPPPFVRAIACVSRITRRSLSLVHEACHPSEASAIEGCAESVESVRVRLRSDDMR
jgi:inhibitor of KinA